MIRIDLVCSPAARQTFEETLQLPGGTTAGQAVALSSLRARLPDLDLAAFTLGIWGRAVEAGQVLADGDRLELCRPLLVDPKVARRERFAKQGARGTGLFARRREGGKPGY